MSETVNDATIVFASHTIVNELKAIEQLVDENNERCEVVRTQITYAQVVSKDGRNMYEVERDEFHLIEKEVFQSGVALKIGIDAIDIVLNFIAPYACIEHPYTPEIREWRDAVASVRRAINAPLLINNIIGEYMKPAIALSEPIPCAITTIGKIRDFDYDQQELMTAITTRGQAGLVDKRILAVANTKGVWIQQGIVDPRTKAKSKHGRPARSSGYRLFGTSQTTFWVKTEHRSADKVFAVKVFQKNVNFETLGGLWADCRDTRDVNETVLDEIRKSLAKPDLVLSGFCASMRNYRFKLLSGENIHLLKLYDIMREMRATTHPNIFVELDISRYPSSIIEIDVPNHTSKKKRITIKVFQSSKINLDSCVFREHIDTWYKFINQFLVDHPEVTYFPAVEDEYDSDYYYNEAGVDPPPNELVDC